jgi:hypothetical protein
MVRRPFACNLIQGSPCANTLAGANTPATASQHALRQGAGEEDGPTRGRNCRQEARAAEEPDFEDMDQYVRTRLSSGGIRGGGMWFQEGGIECGS